LGLFFKPGMGYSNIRMASFDLAGFAT